MKKLIPGLVVAAAMALSASAFAGPLMNQSGVAGAANETATVEQVADGCGAGFFRGPGGRCRPMRRGGVVVAPGVGVLPGVVVVPRRAARFCHRPRTSNNFRC